MYTGQGTKQTALLASAGFVMSRVETRQTGESASENNEGRGGGSAEVAILDRLAPEEVAPNGTTVFVKKF